MAEYIEREAATNVACNILWKMNDLSTSVMAKALNSIPAADVAPVRHGEWEEMHYEGGILDGTNFDRCSVCGYERVFDDPAFKTVFKYCPNCGAKMDGGAD